MSLVAEYKPMLAVHGQPFHSDEYIYEVKWDGYRALLTSCNGQTALTSRNGQDLGKYFPEVLTEVPRKTVVVDGEIVAFNDRGLPDFSLLKRKNSKTTVFMAFDLLNLDGEDLCGYPLFRRRELLEQYIAKYMPTNISLSRPFESDGLAVFEAVKAQGLEGMMAKVRDSLYYPGRRSKEWVKIKNRTTTTCVICGYLPVKSYFRSLLLGQFQDNELLYVGNVGSGFTEGDMEALMALFARIGGEKCPFKWCPKVPKETRWLRPHLVATVEFQEYTGENILRQATFKGLRWDQVLTDCKFEGTD